MTKKQRYSSTISDFECHYIELEIYGLDSTFVSTSEGSESGMTMLIEDAPAWDYGLPEILQQRVENLRSLLEQLYYTPCEVSIPSDPSIDCGDMVMLYTDADSVNSLITSYTWQYRGVMELTSSGVNPYLQTSDTERDRQLRNLKGEIDAAKVIYYPFMNAGRSVFDVEAQRVASVVFTTVADTSVVFQGTVQIDVEIPDIEETQTVTLTIPATEQGEAQTIDVPMTINRRGSGNITIYYIYDTVKQRVTYTDTVGSGGHVISLFYPVNRIEGDTTHTFEVWMSIDNGRAVIREGMFTGAVSGQGLAAISQWNGQLELKDYVENAQRIIPFREARPMEDDVSIDSNTLHNSSTFAEHFARTAYIPVIDMRTLDVSNDDILDLIVRQQTIVFNTKDNVHIAVNRGETKLRTSYVFNGEPVEIDSGTAVSANVELDVVSIDSVVTDCP